MAEHSIREGSGFPSPQPARSASTLRTPTLEVGAFRKSREMMSVSAFGPELTRVMRTALSVRKLGPLPEAVLDRRSVSSSGDPARRIQRIAGIGPGCVEGLARALTAFSMRAVHFKFKEV
jgi:hypothetical protein